jgi:DNA-binding transcriptional ArsR family regulator
MTPGNRFDDFELDDPKAIRALAHPVRLAILVRLQGQGPATASQLAPHVGATASVTSWHLRHLAGFGLVRDAAAGPDRRERRWEATAGGFRVAPATGDEGRSAARALSRQLLRDGADQVARWAGEVEPRLDPDWRGRAGLANTRIVVSAEELDAISDAFEEILAPYVLRKLGRAPAGTRSVRLLRYQLPELEDVAEQEPARDAGQAGPSGSVAATAADASHGAAGVATGVPTDKTAAKAVRAPSAPPGDESAGAET